LVNIRLEGSLPLAPAKSNPDFCKNDPTKLVGLGGEMFYGWTCLEALPRIGKSLLDEVLLSISVFSLLFFNWQLQTKIMFR